MDTRPIAFFHRQRVVQVQGVAPTRTVLDWLREDARCTGTKEGCAEGDCGACTVMVGELGPRGLSLRTVNACIQFLPTLDGKALFTVEDLKTGALHPAQQAMVDCHGSQCGFCTPGFVVSLAACYERHREAGTRPNRQALADELSGNLCRCTGYKPILDAGERMFELPPVRLDTRPAVSALQQLSKAPPLHHRGFHAPRTLASFAALREQKPGAHVLAGSTDVGLWVTKQFRELPELIYIGGVDALKNIDERAGVLRIGAAATLEDAWRALVERIPALRHMWLRFASPPVRNAGTMGGNLANGSPIGDSAPVLMALGASLLLRRGEQQRTLALDGFYLGYMKNALRPGEFVEAIHVPLPGARTQVRAYKLSKRYDSDISSVAAGLAITLGADGRVADVRLAFGGLAAVTQRAAQAEAALRGRAWDEAACEAAAGALAQDFTPLSDMRASAAYRLRAAGNLLRRFWLETRADDPLPDHQTSVWAGMEAAR